MDHRFASGHQIHEGRGCNENTDEKIGFFSDELMGII